MSHANALRQPSIAFPPDVLAHGPSQDFTVRPLNDALGAEIVGIDLARALSAADFARVRRAHLDHHLVVFRDQRITPRQHIDFSRRFGRLMIHVLHQFHLAHNPEILVVSNIVENGAPVGLGDAGKYWHSDISYKPLPSLVRCCMRRNCPPSAAIRCLPICIAPTKRCRAHCARRSMAGARCIPIWPSTASCRRKETGARR